LLLPREPLFSPPLLRELPPPPLLGLDSDRAGGAADRSRTIGGLIRTGCGLLPPPPRYTLPRSLFAGGV